MVMAEPIPLSEEVYLETEATEMLPWMLRNSEEQVHLLAYCVSILMKKGVIKSMFMNISAKTIKDRIRFYVGKVIETKFILIEKFDQIAKQIVGAQLCRARAIQMKREVSQMQQLVNIATEKGLEIPSSPGETPMEPNIQPTVSNMQDTDLTEIATSIDSDMTPTKIDIDENTEEESTNKEEEAGKIGLEKNATDIQDNDKIEDEPPAAETKMSVTTGLYSYLIIKKINPKMRKMTLIELQKLYLMKIMEIGLFGDLLKFANNNIDGNDDRVEQLNNTLDVQMDKNNIMFEKILKLF